MAESTTTRYRRPMSPGSMKEEYLAKLKESLPRRVRQKPEQFRPDYLEVRNMARGNFANNFGYGFKDQYVFENKKSSEYENQVVRPTSRHRFHEIYGTDEVYGLPEVERGVDPVLPAWAKRRHMAGNGMTVQEKMDEYHSNLKLSRPIRKRIGSRTLDRSLLLMDYQNEDEQNEESYIVNEDGTYTKVMPGQDNQYVYSYNNYQSLPQYTPGYYNNYNSYYGYQYPTT